MHLATYNIRGRSSFGVVSGDGVVDLRPRLAPRLNSVLDVLRVGAIEEVKSTVAGVRPDFSLAEVELLPPVVGGEKILCIGVNYANRNAELTAAGGNTEAKYPSMFFKPPNTFVAHNQPILRRRNPSSSNTKAKSRSSSAKPAGVSRRIARWITSPASPCATKAPSAIGSGMAASTSPRASAGIRLAASGRG